MAEHRRARLVAIGTLATVLIVVVMAFVLGGQHTPGESAGSGSPSQPSAGTGENGGSGGRSSINGATKAVARPPTVVQHRAASTSGAGSSQGLTAVAGAPASVPSAVPTSAQGASGTAQFESSADSVTATRVVKTGSLELRVDRGQVQSTVTKLVGITTSMNGYVSQSRTDDVLGSPEGEVTLRIPARHFDAAVTEAEALGHVTSLTTNAHDVTGRFVDLGARLSSLRRTRATYLTILGKATTIGSTLEVQQRVNDTQQQIEEIQGQLKVLRNQSADGTLTVDVTQVGSKTPVHKHHNKHNGIGAAWHRSIDRFARGFDAIVGALGPLLLALMVLAVLAGIAGLGYRTVRRASSQTS